MTLYIVAGCELYSQWISGIIYFSHFPHHWKFWTSSKDGWVSESLTRVMFLNLNSQNNNPKSIAIYYALESLAWIYVRNFKSVFVTIPPSIKISNLLFVRKVYFIIQNCYYCIPLTKFSLLNIFLLVLFTCRTKPLCTIHLANLLWTIKLLLKWFHLSKETMLASATLHPGTYELQHRGALVSHSQCLQHPLCYHFLTWKPQTRH